MTNFGSDQFTAIQNHQAMPNAIRVIPRRNKLQVQFSAMGKQARQFR